MDRCSTCPQKFHVIMGDGPSPCRVLMIGQNPGKVEEAFAAKDQTSRVFIGDAGRELFEMLCPLSGLFRDEDIYITNALKCHTENDRKPSPRELNACASHFLPHELESHRPEVVVLLGGSACSLVPDLQLSVHHGYPFRRNLFGRGYWVVPMFHPAAGMHNAALMTPLIEDFGRLRRILGGDYSTPVNQYPDAHLHYEDLSFNHEKLEAILLHAVGHGVGPHIMARDTETIGGSIEGKDGNWRALKPWCSTFTIDPGTGYMVRADDRQGLRILARYCDSNGYFAILHNAMFDLNIEEAMGFPQCEYEDTMQLAYHQGNLPLGLKPLGWRLCGMTMTDYSDVVMPYSRDAVAEWLVEAYDIASAKPSVKQVLKKRKVPKTAKALDKLMMELSGHELSRIHVDGIDEYFHYYVPKEVDSAVTKKILHIYKHTTKVIAPEAKPYDPWSKWKEAFHGGKNNGGDGNNDAEYEITSRIGSMPQPGIDWVFKKDPQKAIAYAVGDSDATRRIYDVLKSRINRFDDRVIIGDYDL